MMYMFLGIKKIFFCIKEDIFLLLFHNYVCTRIFAHGLSNKIPEYMWKIFMVWLWSFVSKHRMLFGPNHLCGNKIFQYKFYAEDHNKICNNEASIYLILHSASIFWDNPQTQHIGGSNIQKRALVIFFRKHSVEFLSEKINNLHIQHFLW